MRRTKATTPRSVFNPHLYSDVFDRSYPIRVSDAASFLHSQLTQDFALLDREHARLAGEVAHQVAEVGDPGVGDDQLRVRVGVDEPGEVDAVNGAFMLCRAEAIREVGLLDEGYWLYMEDLDWCHRFWDAGWKVFYEPAAVALHVKGGSSARRRAAKQEIAFHRGMGRFYRKHYAADHHSYFLSC